MTRGGGSHRSRALSSMASVGDTTIDDTVRDDRTDATGDESRTVDSRSDAYLETVGRERILMPSNTIARSISAIFKRYLHPTGFAWKMVPMEQRTFYWREFKKEYRWTCADDEVQPIFMKKCVERYRDLVYHMKRNFLTGTKPEFVKDEDWPGWIAYWQAEPTQEKSRVAKKNRLTEPNGLGSSQTHHGGARCAVDHMRDLAKDQHLIEWQARYYTYLKLHCIDGRWTSDKAKEQQDKCDALAAEWRAEGREIDIGEIFRLVSKANKKGRVIGMGNMTPIVRTTSGAGGSSSLSQGGTMYTQGELDARLAEMQAQMEERLMTAQQQMQTQVQEQVQAQVEAQVQAQVQATLQTQIDKQSRMESLLERLLSQQSGSTGEGSRGPDGRSS